MKRNMETKVRSKVLRKWRRNTSETKPRKFVHLSGVHIYLSIISSLIFYASAWRAHGISISTRNVSNFHAHCQPRTQALHSDARAEVRASERRAWVRGCSGNRVVPVCIQSLVPVCSKLISLKSLGFSKITKNTRFHCLLTTSLIL